MKKRGNKVQKDSVYLFFFQNFKTFEKLLRFETFALKSPLSIIGMLLTFWQILEKNLCDTLVTKFQQNFFRALENLKGTWNQNICSAVCVCVSELPLYIPLDTMTIMMNNVKPAIYHAICVLWGTYYFRFCCFFWCDLQIKLWLQFPMGRCEFVFVYFARF